MKKFIFLFLSALLFSCSINNSPNEEKVKEDISSLISKGTDNKIILISFEKQDGLQKTKDNVHYYVMDFKGQVKFQSDVYSKIYKEFYLSIRQIGFLDVKIEKPTDFGYSLVNENAVFDILGSVGYVKKESGWKMNDLNIKLIKK